ncbi:hypothetical protein [Pseudomonas sp. 18058]|uniref:hypothetical protein n=1 Tax=Pseudomonas sp. 18058 TaxID=2681406 RepID=UPI001357F5D5|nr:hypothetical protein [Pseudomonas sp. 18058]
MSSPQRSMIAKVDSALTRCLCVLIVWLISASIWLLGLLSLSDLTMRIFAYGEGWSDVSWAELSFMVIFAVLLWRHTYYCRYFAIGIWKGMGRLLAFQGTLACMGLVIAVFTVDVEQHLGASVGLLETGADPALELGELGFILLALYLAAPTSVAKRLSHSPVSNVESAHTTAEKEFTV